MPQRTGDPTLDERPGFNQGFEGFDVKKFERGGAVVTDAALAWLGGPAEAPPGFEELLRSLGYVDHEDSAPEAAP